MKEEEVEAVSSKLEYTHVLVLDCAAVDSSDYDDDHKAKYPRVEAKK